MKKYKGIEYIIFTHGQLGTFCAYVRLPDTHPWKKKKPFDYAYDSIPIDCHGGLTFSQRVTKLRVKDWPQQFTEGYWIGWDYAHAGDAIPSVLKLINRNKRTDEKFWTEKEVEKECHNVIDQILKGGEYGQNNSKK